MIQKIALEKHIPKFKTPIAIVGNGRITKEYGEEIDACSTIIRFNCFKIRGYENYVGEKITHWCINRILSVQEKNKYTIKRLQEKYKINVITPFFDPILNAQIFSFLGIKKIFCLKRRSSKLLNFLHNTVGFNLVLQFVIAQQPAVLYGFDGLATGHYFNENHVHGKKHKRATLEYDFVRAVKLFDVK